VFTTIANGKCQESVEAIKRLIIKEVDCMPYAKISSISLSVSKTFLVSYLLGDSSDSRRLE